MKKRVKSLLVPYIIWNVVYLLLYWLIGQDRILFSEVPHLFDGKLAFIQFIVTLFIKPLDGPLWFIRNLFVMVVLSPVLYYIIVRTRYLMPFSLLLFTQVIHSPIIESLLWFSFGISFAINNFDFLYFCRRNLVFSIFVALLSVVFDYFVYSRTNNHISSYFSIFKIMSVLGIGYLCVEKHRQWASIKVLNESSFTIYAYHGLIILLLPPYIYRTVCGVFEGVILTYFISIVLIISIGLILSILINKSKVARMLLCGR